MAVKTCLMIGGSGMAGGWINRFVNEFSDRVKIIGLVDIQQEVLDQQAEALGLSEDQLFTDFNQACATVKADFCGVALIRLRLPRQWYVRHERQICPVPSSKIIVMQRINRNW